MSGGPGGGRGKGRGLEELRGATGCLGAREAGGARARGQEYEPPVPPETTCPLMQRQAPVLSFAHFTNWEATPVCGGAEKLVQTQSATV